MDVKTGSNIDFQKNSKLSNATMETFATLSNAQSVLTKNGMFGLVDGIGIHINLGGTVVQVSNISTQNSSGSQVYYQNTPPSGTQAVGNLWYNTTNGSLNIWTNTTWLSIGGNTNTSTIIPTWVANQSYLANQVVLHDGDLWMNITNNTIATTTFNTAEWNNLTKQDTKIFELLRSQSSGSTNGGMALDGSGKIWTINHSCNMQYPTVDVFNKATNKLVVVSLEFVDVNTLKIELVDTLTAIGMDLKLRILC